MNTDMEDLNRKLQQNQRLADFADVIMLRGLGRHPGEYPEHLKAAVAGTAVADMPGLGSRLAQPLVELVNARTVRGRMTGLLDVPPNLPIPVPDDRDVTIVWGEDTPLPLSRFTSARLQTTAKRYGTMFVLTNEVLRVGDGRARNIVLRYATRRLVRADDTAFLSPDAGSADQPAGLLHGLVSIGSGSPSTIIDTIEELVASTSDGAPDSPYFVCSMRGAAYLLAQDAALFREVTLTGGRLAGVPLLISRAAAEKLIFVDASRIANTDNGLGVAASTQASVVMDDDPGVAAEQVSAFQANAAIWRFVRYADWTKLRGDCVAFCELPIGGSPS